VRRRRQAERKVVDRGTVPLHPDLYDARIVVVEQEVPRSDKRGLAVDLQQVLLEQRLRGKVALGEDAHLEELGVQRRKVRGRRLEGAHSRAKRTHGSEGRLHSDNGGRKF